MLSTIVILGGASVVAFLLTSSRVINIRTILKYSVWVDVIFTVVVTICLSGTLTGIATGIIAGLFMALALSGLKVWFATVDHLKTRYTHITERQYV